MRKVAKFKAIEGACCQPISINCSKATLNCFISIVIYIMTTCVTDSGASVPFIIPSPYIIENKIKQNKKKITLKQRSKGSIANASPLDSSFALRSAGLMPHVILVSHGAQSEELYWRSVQFHSWDYSSESHNTATKNTSCSMYIPAFLTSVSTWWAAAHS